MYIFIYVNKTHNKSMLCLHRCALQPWQFCVYNEMHNYVFISAAKHNKTIKQRSYANIINEKLRKHDKRETTHT